VVSSQPSPLSPRYLPAISPLSPLDLPSISPRSPQVVFNEAWDLDRLLLPLGLLLGAAVLRRRGWCRGWCRCRRAAARGGGSSRVLAWRGDGGDELSAVVIRKDQ